LCFRLLIITADDVMNLQDKYLGWGKEVFAIEEQSIREVANSLDEHFAEAVTTFSTAADG